MTEQELMMYKEKLDAIKKTVINPETGEEEEFWSARDLQENLGYIKWDKFNKPIDKAIEACIANGENPDDHFLHVEKMIQTGKGAQRKIDNYNLSRYACDEIAMNCDSRKPEVSAAHAYFSSETNQMEEIREQMDVNNRLQTRGELRDQEKEFSKNMISHGVPRKDIGIIRSEGDKAFFGGHSTQEMKQKLGVPNNRPLNDFTDPVVTLGKAFATEMTNYIIKTNNLQGTEEIGREHISNNLMVRDNFVSKGIKPEDIPPREDIKKVERRNNSKKRKIAMKKLPVLE